MIRNDTELETTQTRIRRFHTWLREMRLTTPPEEFAAISSGYRLEIERMQSEVLEYLRYPTLTPVADSPSLQARVLPA